MGLSWISLYWKHFEIRQNFFFRKCINARAFFSEEIILYHANFVKIHCKYFILPLRSNKQLSQPGALYYRPNESDRAGFKLRTCWWDLPIIHVKESKTNWGPQGKNKELPLAPPLFLKVEDLAALLTLYRSLRQNIWVKDFVSLKTFEVKYLCTVEELAVRISFVASSGDDPVDASYRYLARVVDRLASSFACVVTWSYFSKGVRSGG